MAEQPDCPERLAGSGWPALPGPEEEQASSGSGARLAVMGFIRPRTPHCLWSCPPALEPGLLSTTLLNGF